MTEAPDSASRDKVRDRVGVVGEQRQLRRIGAVEAVGFGDEVA